MLVRTVDDHLFELLEVPRRHGLRVGQLLGEHERDSDLIGADVRVRGDDGTTCVVDALTHHVLPEQSILLLQQLGGEIKISLYYSGTVHSSSPVSGGRNTRAVLRLVWPFDGIVQN